MAQPATYATNSQAATVTTEHVLSAPNAVGTFVLEVDTSVMLAGDVLELRVYKMVRTGGTSRVAFYMRYEGAQAADDYIKISTPIGNDLTDANAVQFTLKQTMGTTRTFPWSVLQWV